MSACVPVRIGQNWGVCNIDKQWFFFPVRPGFFCPTINVCYVVSRQTPQPYVQGRDRGAAAAAAARGRTDGKNRRRGQPPPVMRRGGGVAEKEGLAAATARVERTTRRRRGLPVIRE